MRKILLVYLKPNFLFYILRGETAREKDERHHFPIDGVPLVLSRVLPFSPRASGGLMDTQACAFRGQPLLVPCT